MIQTTTNGIVLLTADDDKWLTESNEATEITARTLAKTIRYKEGIRSADEFTEIDSEAYAAYVTAKEEAQEQEQTGDE